MEEEACIINIGRKERAKRMRFGVVMYAVSGVITLLMVGFGLNRWLRLVLFLPLALGGLGVFQAREKT